MKEKLKKLANREFLIYLLFGVLTTVVNYVIFCLMLGTFGDGSALWANAVAFVGAVLFAFFTNKPFVFESKSWAPGIVFKEFVSFTGARLASFGIEELGLFVCQDLLHMDQWSVLNISGLVYGKLALSVITVLLNYIFSKFIVFRKAKQNEQSET